MGQGRTVGTDYSGAILGAILNFFHTQLALSYTSGENFTVS
jgi:hypothetical protein